MMTIFVLLGILIGIRECVVFTSSFISILMNIVSMDTLRTEIALLHHYPVRMKCS